MVMSRNSLLTYRGALRILGRYEPPIVEKLDQAAGGLVLGAGIVAGAIAIAGNPAPAIALAVWSWVDQKNEASKLLRSLVKKLPGRIRSMSGYPRTQLITAAHTAIVVDSFFSALRDEVGDLEYGALELSEDDVARLASGGAARAENVASFVYASEVPAPGAALGFEENSVLVQRWLQDLANRSFHFFAGLSAWKEKDLEFAGRLEAAAVEKYRQNYADLARDVPEFMIWAILGEHSATRVAISDGNAELAELLKTVTNEALLRLEKALEVGRPLAAIALTPSRSVVYRANRGALAEQIIAPGSIEGIPALKFPRVEEIYIEPRYRYCRNDEDSLIADENWWKSRRVYSDISVFLAAHITSAEATSVPLLVLGHPGSGKSLLTKVMAARLPDSGYTVVRVPLRRVRADRPLYEQIQEALDGVTHGRVKWADLAEESRDTIRVILLDGLDELLQASPGAHRKFFRDIADFQLSEANQELPAVVIVTSRTLVADQVELPLNAPVLKLEDFNKDQVLRWLSVWEKANSSGISTGSIKRLGANVALQQDELSSQPLLLLMLAVYAADPQSEPLTNKLSKAALYRQLLTTFTTREVSKKASPLEGARLQEAAREHLWALTVAAFAMFNRGRQHVSDYQLGADLTALDHDYLDGEMREADLGRQVAAQFFFIHSAEARIAGQPEPIRSYEFLHATFGEYLVAQQIMAMISDLRNQDRKRGAQDIDALPFALLSCQPLVGRMSILHLVNQLSSELDDGERAEILSAVDDLIRTYRRRHNFDTFSGYKATPGDRILALAFYSLNLVSLRIALSRDWRLRLEQVWVEGDHDALQQWQTTVKLWESALDPGSWQSVINSLEYWRKTVRFMPTGRLLVGSNFRYSMNARLLGDTDLEERLRAGTAITHKSYYYVGGDDWEASMVSSLRGYLHARGYSGPPLIARPPRRTTRASVGRVAIEIARVLKLASRPEHKRFAAELVNFLLSLPNVRPDPVALASALLRFPSLGRTIPELMRPERYIDGGWAVWLIFAANESNNPAVRELRDAVLAGVQGAPATNTIPVKEAAHMLKEVLRSYEIQANVSEGGSHVFAHQSKSLTLIHSDGTSYQDTPPYVSGKGSIARTNIPTPRRRKN
ncbi:NACHT domain-containing protein [Micromonospora sp. NPDC005553]|uniref:NACHT domain-containing protein n=1 Tax=Micromonospora sp. NPDC005553 TaxID=3364232 RepID=UPI0036CAED39